MKTQDTSNENHVVELTRDERMLLRKGLRMLGQSLEAEENKAIDILNQIIGNDEDKTLEYFRAYQNRLSKKLATIGKLDTTLKWLF